jgi:hypothetical protein
MLGPALGLIFSKPLVRRTVHSSQSQGESVPVDWHGSYLLGRHKINRKYCEQLRLEARIPTYIRRSACRG